MIGESDLRVEPLGESGGHCDCCGRDSKRVWGLVYGPRGTEASYFVHWTVGGLTEHDANIDLIMGAFGEGTTREERVGVSLLHREDHNGRPAVMVIDAADRPTAASDLVGNVLSREEVIGTPLAAHVFALVDAIYLQDNRFF